MTLRHSSEAPSGDVVVAGLTKSFGDHLALRGVDLVVPERSITAILGPSGSGKTTLLRLLVGFERPDAGTITVGGSLVEGPRHHVRPEVRRIGYVPQEGSLFPHLDVKGNVGFGLPRSGRQARVADLLSLTGMSEFAARYPHQLSGGQQQRVALARALAPDPRLVLLDEPFASLDAHLRAEVRTEVVRILRQTHATALVVTHDQNEALSIADQVAVLRDGVVAQCASPEEVYICPADATLARFVGDANIVAGLARGGRVQTVFGSLPVGGEAAFCEGASVVAVLRPEQIELEPLELEPGGVGEPAHRGPPARGTVLHTEYYGHDSVVVVDPGGGSDPIRVRCSGAAPVQMGATVGLRARGAVVAWVAEPPRRHIGDAQAGMPVEGQELIRSS